MSGWPETSTGGGWEASNSGWGAASPTGDPAPLPEQPPQPALDNFTDHNGNNVDNAAASAGDSVAGPAEGAAAAAPAQRRANEQWAVHDREGYDYAHFAVHGDDYDGNVAVYHWDGEEGDLGPEHPELEIELFGPPDKREVLLPDDFTKVMEIQVEQEGPVRIVPIQRFEDAGLHPAMAKNIELCGYKIPTAIQKYCLPAVKQGHDVIGIAQTGSGKTAAYLIPILNKLMGKAKKLAAPRPNPATYRPGVDPVTRAEPLVCIVCPTRELAIQIFMEARKLCYRSMLRPCVIYGGGPIRHQMDQLALGCDILIASPGRLIDFIDRPEILTLRRLKYMVIDEADEMLHDDWSDDFAKILGGGEQEEGNIQYMLFSATFPKNLRELAMTHLATEHVRLWIGRPGSAHANIVQEVVLVESHLKRQACLDLLNSMPPARTIIFVNSKRTADELDDYLFNSGMPTTSIHSDRTQREREDAMRAFRAGKSPILIATGLSARGIDVRNIVHVVNYDLPSVEHGGIEEYTHRIGRTGRIGHRGLATSFYSPDRDEGLASVLVRTMLETDQTIPEFLQEHMPEGDDRTKLKFESEGDFGDDFGADTGGNGGWAGNTGGDSGWTGGGDSGAAPAPPGGGNAWGGGGEASGGGWNSPAASPTDEATDSTWASGGAAAGWS